jgi:hypothetical protein
LSSELLWHSEILEREMLEYLTADERKDYETHRGLVDGIVQALISTRETMRSGDFTVFDQFAGENREIVDGLLDSHYAIVGLKQIRSIVDRTMKLAQLRSRQTPSAQTNRYIQEAARAFINGLPMASIAMSRAALEQALKEVLGRQGDGRYIEFRKLVDDAKRWNILGATGENAARDLARECNDLLHEKPTDSDEEAFRILAAIRSLIQEIYSADGSL